MKFIYYSIYFFCTLFAIKAPGQDISWQANKILLQDPAISMGHIGISIYEPATDKYWYNYNATKYFIPASNTKLFSLYAGMKYLGDSLVGLRYEVKENGEYFLYPAADPTFLHPDFKWQPVFSFLKNIPSTKNFICTAWKTNTYGKGWGWDDYSDYYMAERSLMPVYGNVISFSYVDGSLTAIPPLKFDLKYSSDYQFDKPNFWVLKKNGSENFSIKRRKESNVFEFISSDTAFEPISIPFITDTTLLKNILLDTLALAKNDNIKFITNSNSVSYKNLKIIYSQPSDAVFIPMMHRSDNFFAEQTLLMASNEYLGYVSENAIIDTLLKTTLHDIPQKPLWVDGSGLSRYNLFTPKSFIYILKKLKDDFGIERMKKILPTGGEGTLKKYYKNKSGYIFAKTGTLTNNVALSGYLITKKNKLLLFSIMAGNFTSAATPVRKAIEKYLIYLQETY